MNCVIFGTKLQLCNYVTHYSALFAKLRKATGTFIMSVGLHGKTRLQLDGFS